MGASMIRRPLPLMSLSIDWLSALQTAKTICNQPISELAGICWGEKEKNVKYHLCSTGSTHILLNPYLATQT